MRIVILTPMITGWNIVSSNLYALNLDIIYLPPTLFLKDNSCAYGRTWHKCTKMAAFESNHRIGQLLRPLKMNMILAGTHQPHPYPHPDTLVSASLSCHASVSAIWWSKVTHCLYFNLHRLLFFHITLDTPDIRRPGYVMMVADILASNRLQAISNHHAESSMTAQSVWIIEVCWRIRADSK